MQQGREPYLDGLRLANVIRRDAWRWRRPARLAIVLICGFGAACTNRSAGSLPHGLIANEVERARRDGRAAVNMNVSHAGSEPYFSDADLDAVLKSQSAIVLAPSGRSTVVAEPDYIRTCHVLGVVAELARRVDGSCNVPVPREVSLGEGEVAVPLVQGSITVAGGTVTVHSPHENISFAGAERFLIIGQVCPSNVLVPLGRAGVFTVSTEGALSVPGGTELPRFAHEIVRLGSIDEVRIRLAQAGGRR